MPIPPLGSIPPKVKSVFGRVGAVVLTKADVTGTGLTFSDVSALSATAAVGGDLAGNMPNPTIPSTVLRSAGTSTSSTPGTTIASISASAGKQLIDVSLFGGQVGGTGTQLTVTVTYTDSSTTTATTSASTTTNVFLNGGAIVLVAGANFTVTALSAKEISSISVTTTGTGTGNRVASLSALQVSQ